MLRSSDVAAKSSLQVSLSSRASITQAVLVLQLRAINQRFIAITDFARPVEFLTSVRELVHVILQSQSCLSDI